ncbi:MAG: restriction endonuclease subunit S [Kiritimatiellia bacterium]
MKKGWTEVALGDVLERVERFENRDEFNSYQFAGTYSYARGIFRGDLRQGYSFNLPRVQRIKNGDFIYCKIMAWEGAFGLAGSEVNDCVMSGAFVAYITDQRIVHPRYLSFWFKSEKNWKSVAATSTGTNVRRKSLHPCDFERNRICLPPLAEQQRIVAHLDAVEERIKRVQTLREEQDHELLAALRSAFHKIEATADWVEMGEVAALVRRPVEIEPDGRYPELGVRSFGRGAFHKPDVLGIETTKRLFEIYEGDLLFSNVFAWEGAIAVAQKDDHGRFGSHRFMSCVCDRDRVLPEFLQFYFLTAAGLEKIGQASPGGAGRNRTLGIKKLENITVPIPSIKLQHEFLKLLTLRNRIKEKVDKSTQRREALLPSLLDRIFSEASVTSQ